jgi:hypothetical protein
MRRRLTIFGRRVYYISLASVFQGGFNGEGETNYFWKVGVLYIIRIYFSRRIQRWLLGEGRLTFFGR